MNTAFSLGDNGKYLKQTIFAAVSPPRKARAFRLLVFLAH